MGDWPADLCNGRLDGAWLVQNFVCFSAIASFSAGALLLCAGVLTLKFARRPSELPDAAVPLLFAIQQLSEGVIWLTFCYEAPLLNAAETSRQSSEIDGA